jgi:hypothetical protein
MDMKNYDGDLQMFAEMPTAVSLPRLWFLRWLVEQGRLEHPPAGPSSGSLVEIHGEEATATSLAHRRIRRAHPLCAP